MSYLNLPRISFSGLFEADVNTVNNDVRNYDATVFEPRLQTAQITVGDHTEYNGWWNPAGSNRFSLIGCAVTGAVGPKGEAASGDEVLTLRLEAQFDRTAGKIVDLDPQFQFASALWGLRIGLMAGDKVLMRGSFYPGSFRDLFFSRLFDQATNQPVSGSPSASARFTGALYDIAWDESAEASPILSALKASAAANQGQLMLSLITYGYSKSGGTQEFLSGSVIGCIGPWLAGEPLSFAPGRRFAISAASPNAPFASAQNIGYLTGLVTNEGQGLSLDLGVALPLLLADGPGGDGAIHTVDLGPITIAVARQGDTLTNTPTGLSVTPGVTEGQALTPDQYEVISVLTAYDMAWMQANGGVADFAVPAAAQALIGDHPLLLLTAAPTPPGQIVAIRETFGGLWTRADDFVQRLDSAPTGWVSSAFKVWAMLWGQPWANAPLTLSVQPRATGQGGTDDPDEVKPPQTYIPDNNVPAATISLPATATAGADGTVQVTYWAANPGNPRGYIDGQIYQLNYSPTVAGQSPMPMVEVVAVHVRDAYVPPPVPSWDTDVKPVLTQYGNLYPIMSRGLFSLSDFDAASANARLLHLAFTLPPTDPNFMPATRDISAGKLRMIVDWLRSYLPHGAPSGYGAIPPLPVGQPLPPALSGAAPAQHPTQITPALATAAVEALGPGNDGKTAAVRGFLKNAARAGDGG
ncbi:MAG: hypothetical protein P4L64_06130 [Caulobacteraceae bacterium]|nr:hypothetical protein [Caulobacteraceae bacterium]